MIYTPYITVKYFTVQALVTHTMSNPRRVAQLRNNKRLG